MYQWRKFDFFEEKSSGRCAVPAEVEGNLVCCTSGRGRIAVGCDDGWVSLLDRGLKFVSRFQAYSVRVLFIQQLKQRNYLIAVGEDERISPQNSPFYLKLFDLDKSEPESSSTYSPECIQMLQIFPGKVPEAKITSFLVFEGVPPYLYISIGLDNGLIRYIDGEDIARNRSVPHDFKVESASESENVSITGLGYKPEGRFLQLFAVTPISVNLFALPPKPSRRQTIDQIGCGVNAVTMNDLSELIIGRPEAIYFYEVDGRGPCWAFDGEKKFVGWFRDYLLCVTEDQTKRRNVFNVYDLKNKLIAHSLVVKEVSHMLCEWGNIVLIMHDKTAIIIGEKDMESKLDMLFKKNLYTVAINLVQSHHADAGATAEVLRKYGDHLYGKQEYDEAMAQYIHTIGHLEPSYVIQKFLDAQRIYNLTSYLESLHEKGLASKDHTTLLLNCYTKLKDVKKLDLFIKGDDAVGEHKFDVDTAIRVCRAAGYHEHAMYVAKKAGKHERYLKILLEDLDKYSEALDYISGLEPFQAGITIKEYGKILVKHRPVETVNILIRLCIGDGELNERKMLDGTHLSMLPSPIDFMNIFIHYPQALMDFLEKYLSIVTDSPAQVEINNTLLELYLSNDLSFPTLSLENGGEIAYSSSMRNLTFTSTAFGAENNDVSNKQDRLQRLEKGLKLLKSGWPADMDQPLYDVDLAIILCEMYSFKEGLLFLYEATKLYKEVISCYMQAHDHTGLIACCKKLGDSTKGGDPSLWADLLKYFGELGEDCSQEVKEVLTYIERDDVLPPIVVIQTLAKNPCLGLSVVKDYISRKVEHDSKLIEEDRKAIEKYQEDTTTMRKEIQDLKTNARIFQLSKCTACTFTLDLPAVHFMCMHSFHQRCLGDNEKECPECAPEYRSVLEAKRKLEQNARDHKQFIREVKNAKDGFSVIAEYFAKGVISKTATPPVDNLQSDSLPLGDF